MLKQNDNQVEFAIIVMFSLFLILATLLLTNCCGPRGHDGSNGNTGAIGPQGPSISVLTQPATSTECANGGTDLIVGTNAFTVCNGTPGIPGTDGSNGSNGPQGDPGTNATPITFEQVCAGITPSYPSTFPEFIMNLGGVAYGVYSTNGGFMALLPPGTYSSNGVNASCTFVINADGTVTP